MYSGKGFEVSELGDIDVFRHKGYYHLFHLVLPNHDYIAHAVSRDGFLWRRVKNALFIGEPGAWDDDMVWTMHVSRDPYREDWFRMFYTGLSRKEGGRVQRLGMARSQDLYSWEKESGACCPLSISGPYYESTVEEGRHWVSCRDPFFFKEGDEQFLLVDARVPSGPVARRGCVGIAREREEGHLSWEAPLFYPRMYDDIEVPGLHRINGRYYLFGNIKEDIKIHYWQSDVLNGPYESYASNVLMPKGNYALRVTREDDGSLLAWNFFTDRDESRRSTILPPPTELCTDEEGELYLTSYRKFDDKVQETLAPAPLREVSQLLDNPTASVEFHDRGMTFSSDSGYEIFLLGSRVTDFRLRFTMGMAGLGKMGVVFRSDGEANAHYISLDMIHGFAQGRIWGFNEQGGIENSYRYRTIQDNKFEACSGKFSIVEVIAFGGYVELSVNGKVVLRYVETSYYMQDLLGFYVESASINIVDITLEALDGPVEEDHQVL